MYKLSRRKNLTPFLLLVAIGLAVSISVPPLFSEQVFEIPSFALFPAEIALVMMLSVLFFENATPPELLRLSFTMLALAMVSGSFCNMIGKSSQTLPDYSLLLNWVQLICMNVTGLAATIALYQTRAPEAAPLKSSLREPSEKRPGATADEFPDVVQTELAGEKMEVASGESVKDILDKLDVSRINRLEKQISREKAGTEGSSVSLDSLFADESHAAQTSKPMSTPAADDSGNGPSPPASKRLATSLESLFEESGADRPASPMPLPPPPNSQLSDQQPGKTKAAASIDDLFGDIAIGADFVPPPAKVEEPASPPAPEAASATTPYEVVSAASEPVPTLSPGDAVPILSLDEPAPTLSLDEPVPILSLDEPAVDLFSDLALDLEAPPKNFVPTPTPPPTPTQAQAAPESSSSLFDESNLGGDLEDIFANLAPEAANDEFSPAKLAEIKAHTAPEPVPAVAESIADGKLFGDGLGADLDNIFDNLAPAGAQKDISELLLNKEPVPPLAAPSPAVPVAASSKPAEPAGGGSSGGKEVKEFGRLSAATTAKMELQAPGTLKTIGQMLLDTQAVENIINRSANKTDDGAAKITAATARVVTAARGADIQQMLNKVASFPGIDGSLVIGKDGLLIGSTESLGMMRDVLGVLALGIQSTTNLGTKKVDLGELRQAILRTGEKVTILTEVGIGVLACFSDHWNLDTLDALLEHIGTVVNESQSTSGASLPSESLTGGLLGAADSTPSAPAAPPPAAPPAPVAPEAPPAKAEAPAAREIPVPISDAKGGLLSVDDEDISSLFDSVLSESGVRKATKLPADAGVAKAKPDTAGAPAAAAPQGTSGLLAVDDDMMSDIFDNLLDKSETVEQAMDFSPSPNAPAAAAAKVEPAPAAKVEPAPAAKSPSMAPGDATADGGKPGAPGKQMKEFGRLSSSAAAASEHGQDGAIKAIGRQLIDVQAVENIIKAGEKRERMGAGLTTARVISAARGEGIRALLTKIDGCPGVAGSLIVGNDGLVIASTLQGGLDKDLLGALCTAMYSHTELAVRKVDYGKMKQIIFHATDRITVLTQVAVGVLAVFVENHDMAAVDSLLAAIEQTVRG